MSAFPPPAPYGDASNEARTDGRAIASLVCGIVGLLFFGLILGVLAFILGRRSRRDITERPWALKGLGLATAGMVLGMLDVLFFVVFVAIVR